MKRVKEILYEKFEEQSDPIEDLGIGMLHRISEGLKKLMNVEGVEFISLEKYFSDAWSVEARYYNILNKKRIIYHIEQCLGKELFKNIGTRLYGDKGKVIGVGLIKKEYQRFFDQVIDDAGNIKNF
jgi:hypothetical protein